MILLIQNYICVITKTNNMIILSEGFLRKTITYFEIRNMIYFFIFGLWPKNVQLLKNIWFKISRVVGDVTNQFLLTLVHNYTLQARMMLWPTTNYRPNNIFLQNMYVIRPSGEYWKHLFRCKYNLRVVETFFMRNPFK